MFVSLVSLEHGQPTLCCSALSHVYFNFAHTFKIFSEQLIKYIFFTQQLLSLEQGSRDTVVSSYLPYSFYKMLRVRTLSRQVMNWIQILRINVTETRGYSKVYIPLASNFLIRII